MAYTCSTLANFPKVIALLSLAVFPSCTSTHDARTGNLLAQQVESFSITPFADGSRQLPPSLENIRGKKLERLFRRKFSINLLYTIPMGYAFLGNNRMISHAHRSQVEASYRLTENYVCFRPIKILQDENCFQLFASGKLRYLSYSREPKTLVPIELIDID